MMDRSARRRLRTLMPQLVAAADLPATARRRTRREANSTEGASRTHTRDGTPMLTPITEAVRAGGARLAADRGLPYPTSFSQLTFRTNDLPKLSEWWRTLLDMEPTHESENLHVYRVEAEEPFTLAFMGFTKEECPDRKRNDVAVDHFAINYASLTELFAMYKRMKEKLGVVPSMPIHHGYAYSLYYTCPDGTRVECQVDAWPDVQSVKAFWQTKDMNAEGGGGLKPEEDMAAFESGQKTGSDILTRWKPRGRPLTGDSQEKKEGARKPGVREFLTLNGPTAPPNQPSSFLTRPVNGVVRSASYNKGQPLYIQHVAFQSEKPDEVNTFYNALLSADQAMEIGPGMAIFSTWDEENHRIVVATATPGKKSGVAARVKDSVGVHSAQWSYETRGELLAQAKRLRRRGILPFKTLRDPVGGISLYYHDPDKNICELRHVDRAKDVTLWETLRAAGLQYPAGEEFGEIEELEV